MLIASAFAPTMNNGPEHEQESNRLMCRGVRDVSGWQLQKHKEEKKASKEPPLMTTSHGTPIYEKKATLTAGPRGPLLMEDVVYLNEIQHFDRERIPERVVHAKGGGAHGYFEVTHDITRYCKADIFSEVGKQTPMFARFSTVAGESGSPDTARDPRGFALKFYTEEGNWDLVGNNTPIFFIRDAIHFPSFIHALKRNPATHLRDWNTFFDFTSLRQESTHQVMFLFTDRGTPDGFRFMNGYGSHTFKMVNNDGNAVYCKFHFKPKGGIKTLTAQQSDLLAGSDPDRSIRDLYESIEKGNFPEWEMLIQVMTFDQANTWEFNPFDVTKVWPHGEYPLMPVGKFVLNKNPKNYFAEVEQAAFSPAHVVPGIEFSPDKMLQGRLVSYDDTHFHRLGPNYAQLPINCPFRATANNIQRDGLMTFNSQDGTPVYHPSSFNEPKEPKSCHYKEHKHEVRGEVNRYDDGELNNFEQPRAFWLKVLDENGRETLVKNLASVLCKCHSFIIDRVVEQYNQVHPDFGWKLREAVDGLLAENERKKEE